MSEPERCRDFYKLSQRPLKTSGPSLHTLAVRNQDSSFLLGNYIIKVSLGHPRACLAHYEERSRP